MRAVEDVRRLLQVGADKVCVNTAAVDTSDLIRQVAERFGSQCVVVSIDARHHANGRHEVYTRSGARGTGLEPVEVVRRAEV